MLQQLKIFALQEWRMPGNMYNKRLVNKMGKFPFLFPPPRSRVDGGQQVELYRAQAPFMPYLIGQGVVQLGFF